MLSAMLTPPRSAVALGAAGLVPAVAAAVALLWGPDDWQPMAATVCATYAAVILSFLGGAWWGIAAREAQATRPAGVFCAAVLPSLAGWSALLVDRGAGLIALGLLFLAVLPGDVWLVRARLAPDWWMSLRAPLSVGMAGLAIVAGAALELH